MAECEARNDGTADRLEINRKRGFAGFSGLRAARGTGRLISVADSARSKVMDESLDAPARASEPQAAETRAAQTVSRFKWIGWSRLFFAFGQSVWTIFVSLTVLSPLLCAPPFGSA